MGLVHYTFCPVCGSGNLKNVFTVKDFTVSKKEFVIAGCNDCTLRFTQDVPGVDSIGPYYKSENYISHTDTSKGLVNSLYKKIRNRTLRQKRKLIEVITNKKNGTLLDVGSGRGYFLARVKGKRTVGCDLLGGDVMASAERLPFKTKAFDIVTCFHTLEHTRNLAAAIAELRRVARRQLIVIVPRQRRFFYTLDLHLQFFETPEALAKAMGGGGEIRQFGSDLVYISAP